VNVTGFYGEPRVNVTGFYEGTQSECDQVLRGTGRGLTAVELVALVQAVVVSVTEPVSGHTAAVPTEMLTGLIAH